MILKNLHLGSGVYFNQRLVAVHSKCWLKSAFLMFFRAKKLKKEEKAQKLKQNYAKKVKFEFAPILWSRVLYML